MEWSAGQLASVYVGTSGAQVMGATVLSLRIEPHHAKEIGLLAELDDEELEWIADLLEDALGLADED